jgi:hypothetical protein
VLNANLATFGLVAADLTPLTNARNDFQTKLGNFQTAETAFRAASRKPKRPRATPPNRCFGRWRSASTATPR